MPADHNNRSQLLDPDNAFVFGWSEIVLGLKMVDRMIGELQLWKEVTIYLFLE